MTSLGKKCKIIRIINWNHQNDNDSYMFFNELVFTTHVFFYDLIYIFEEIKVVECQRKKKELSFYKVYKLLIIFLISDSMPKN